MSELAFNVNGERFDLPTEASHWRVRRFKPSGRGTPDVVFSSDGLPLIIPIDTDIGEFRSLVGNQSGRYRLDAMDDDQKSVDDAQAAYLQLSGAAPASDAPRQVVHANSGDAELMREIVRTNAEMVRTIAEKFATIMDSAATLLRAADGAGMPNRDPRPMVPLELANTWRNAEQPRVVAEPEQHDDDGDDEPDGNARIATILQTVAEQTMPLVRHAIQTKFMGLTPEQSLALMGGVAATPPASAPTPVDDRSPTTETNEPHEQRSDAAATPPPPVNFMLHLAAIDSKLSREDSRLIREIIKHMPPAALAQWKEQLVTLTPDEAAQLVRTELERLRASQEAKQQQPAETKNTDQEEAA